MKISSINAMSYNNTARSLNSTPQDFGSAKKVMHKAGNTMKALMLAGMMGMAAVNMSSCKPTIEPTPIENLTEEEPTVDEGEETETPVEEEPTTPTDETPTEETPVVDEGETTPVEEEPTTPVDDEPTTPIDEEPVIDEPTTPVEENPIIDILSVDDSAAVSAKDKNFYKIISALGFDISTEEVLPVKGQYQPKSGEITSFSYTDTTDDYEFVYDYTLDRKNSTADKLQYNLHQVGGYKTGWMHDNGYDNIDWDTPYNTITIDKEGKSIKINEEKYDSRSYTLKDNGAIQYSQYGSDILFEIDKDKKICSYNNAERTISNIKFSLADDDATEEATIDSQNVKNSWTYKTLNDLGFNVKVAQVEPIDGQYQPKAGEITEFSYINYGAEDSEYTYLYHFDLDREESSEYESLYTSRLYYQDKDGKIVAAVGSMNKHIIVNQEEKSVEIYDEKSKSSIKYSLNADNTITESTSSGNEIYTIGEDKSMYHNGRKVTTGIKFVFADGTGADETPAVEITDPTSLVSQAKPVSAEEFEKINGTKFYKFQKGTYSISKDGLGTIYDIANRPYDIAFVETNSKKGIKNGDILELQLIDRDNNTYSIKRNSNGTYNINNDGSEYVLSTDSIYELYSNSMLHFTNETWAKKNKSQWAKSYTINGSGQIIINNSEDNNGWGYSFTDTTSSYAKSRKAAIAYVPEK